MSEKKCLLGLDYCNFAADHSVWGQRSLFECRKWRWDAVIVRTL
jgi:hypothetical protein